MNFEEFYFVIFSFCIFTLILQRAKVSKYHQSIKIRFSTQNIKISAVSTPIFARISPFFCIFRDLSEYIGENASKCQKMQKSFAPNFGNFQKISKKQLYFDILYTPYWDKEFENIRKQF